MVHLEQDVLLRLDYFDHVLLQDLILANRLQSVLPTRTSQLAKVDSAKGALADFAYHLEIFKFDFLDHPFRRHAKHL